MFVYIDDEHPFVIRRRNLGYRKDNPCGVQTTYPADDSKLPTISQIRTLLRYTFFFNTNRNNPDKRFEATAYAGFIPVIPVVSFPLLEDNPNDTYSSKPSGWYWLKDEDGGTMAPFLMLNPDNITIGMASKDSRLMIRQVFSPRPHTHNSDTLPEEEHVPGNSEYPASAVDGDGVPENNTIPTNLDDACPQDADPARDKATADTACEYTPVHSHTAPAPDGETANAATHDEAMTDDNEGNAGENGREETDHAPFFSLRTKIFLVLALLSALSYFKVFETHFPALPGLRILFWLLLTTVTLIACKGFKKHWEAAFLISLVMLIVSCCTI